MKFGISGTAGGGTVVFDEFLPNQSIYYTQSELIDPLGLLDQLSIHCVVDSANAGSITVHIQHSANGIHWLNKNTNGEIATTNNYLESNGTVNAGTTSLSGSDSAVQPSLAYVRLSIQLAGGATQAWVKLWATGRDIR